MYSLHLKLETKEHYEYEEVLKLSSETHMCVTSVRKGVFYYGSKETLMSHAFTHII
jgi:hypothetical protein